MNASNEKVRKFDLTIAILVGIWIFLLDPLSIFPLIVDFKYFETTSGALLIAIAGWLIALLLQNYKITKEHRNKIKYDIYRELLKISRETNDSITSLVVFFPSFILMEAAMIGSDPEPQKLFKSGQEWLKMVTGLQDNLSNFSDKYINLLYLFEGWSAALSSLSVAEGVLKTQIDAQLVQLRNDVQLFQMYTVSHGYDWRVWDKDDVNKIAERIRDAATIIQCYVSDYMVLVHNELLPEYFGHERPLRMPRDSKYLVLTKEGLVQRVEEMR